MNTTNHPSDSTSQRTSQKPTSSKQDISFFEYQSYPIIPTTTFHESNTKPPFFFPNKIESKEIKVGRKNLFFLRVLKIQI